MSRFFRSLLSFVALSGSLLPAVAQRAVPQANRITVEPSAGASTRLKGYIPAWAAKGTEAGPVSPATTIRLTFTLTRSPERQAAFEQMLSDLQNPASPYFHHWLTPEQIGTLYGPTQHDVDALTSWLTGQGFTIVETAASRVFVTAEAPASVVSNALSTSFHYVHPASAPSTEKPRLAATTEPAIPAALAPLIGSISGLSETPIRPMQQMRAVPRSSNGAQPDATASDGSHYLVPGDFATIYDLNPLYQAGFTGSGQKIAVIGRSRVDPTDITTYENLVSLPTNTPNIIIPTNGTDPGLTNTTDQDEATVDVDRVIGTAPKASVDLVVSGNAASGTNGLNIAAQYEVQTLKDPVMTISFSECEANGGATEVQFWDSLFQQAAGEGISVFVSSGDSGADECQASGAAPTGTLVRSINDICASSYATCVGGTELNDFASPSTYWNSSNNSDKSSALSYIPEGAWNEPTAEAANGVPYAVIATGGGASTIITKPTWQTGNGVPQDGFRDIPDVSFAAGLHDGYIACLAYKGYNCNPQQGVFGGTSAAAPAMAGIAAILNQKSGGALGNFNPFLYAVASSNAAAFHDANPSTIAGSGATCDLNTASYCNNSLPSATGLTGGLAGYALTNGYDQATGLGSLDVNALTLGGLTVTAASSSLTLSPGAGTGNTDALTVNSALYSGNVSFSCTVTPTSGTPILLPFCSVNPSSVSISSNGTASGTLVISTVSPQQQAAAAKNQTATMNPPSTHAGGPSSGATLPLVALASVALLVMLPRRRTLPTLTLLILGVGTLTSCTGSSTPESSNPLLTSTTQTTLTEGASYVVPGGSTTFTATVANTGFNVAVAPSGTVKFYENGGTTPIATATLVNGTATTAAVSFPNAGVYSINAVYAGDNNFSGSTSNAVTLPVTAGGTSTGTYNVTVTAAGSNNISASTTVGLTIQ